MKHRALALTLLAAGMVATPAVPAASDWLGLLQVAQREAAVSISPAQAAQQAQRQYGGKVLSVTLEQKGKRAFYQVKLLDSGQVRKVTVPAN